MPESRRIETSGFDFVDFWSHGQKVIKSKGWGGWEWGLGGLGGRPRDAKRKFPREKPQGKRRKRMFQSERSHANDSRRRIPSERSQAKHLLRKVPSDRYRSQAKVLKPRIPSENFQAVEPKRKSPSERSPNESFGTVSHAKVPVLNVSCKKSQANSPKLNFPRE